MRSSPARPNFTKIVRIIDALRAAQAQGSSLRYRLVHTGQHYDMTMSGDLFEQLGIPEPDITRPIGSLRRCAWCWRRCASRRRKRFPVLSDLWSFALADL
jgi:hypothetical protein